MCGRFRFHDGPKPDQGGTVPWITPEALDRARGHAAAISARITAAGFGSSTLARIQDDLASELPVDPKTGWIVLTGAAVTQLRADAAALETLLRERSALRLGDHDLPQLRYLLSEEVVG
jgi:hypothetical protein